MLRSGQRGRKRAEREGQPLSWAERQGLFLTEVHGETTNVLLSLVLQGLLRIFAALVSGRARL